MYMLDVRHKREANLLVKENVSDKDTKITNAGKSSAVLLVQIRNLSVKLCIN